MSRRGDGVSGQAQGLGNGWAVETKTAPMEYVEVTVFGAVEPIYIPTGRRLPDVRPDPAAAQYTGGRRQATRPPAGPTKACWR